MPKPKHILVIRLSAMGDVAMTVPVLRALTDQYPELKITLLTRAFFAPFFRDLPNVSVFHADVKDKHKGILGLYNLSKELKKLNFDAVADLHNVLRSKILKRFLSIKLMSTIDKGRAEKKELISGRIKHALKSTHIRYTDVFAKLGYSVSLEHANHPNPVKLIDFELSKGNNKWIGIAPFAQYESKMYPLDKMKEVVRTLSRKYTVILFGGGDKEKRILDKWEETFDNVLNLTEKYDLNKELDIISNLDLMLSMDSGNAHLAAMLGKKVVTIWGVTHPNAGFSPFKQPTDFALLANQSDFPLIPTSVYGNIYPEAYKHAAGSIPVQTIINKIESLL